MHISYLFSLEELDIKPENKVHDLGCGTGILTILTKKKYLIWTKWIRDSKILKIAEYNPKRRGLDICWNYGLASKLPYSENYFNKVVQVGNTSFEFWNKINAFREIFRVLKPNGEFY